MEGDLHGTTLSPETSLQQAYHTNCFVLIKPTTHLRLSCTLQKYVGISNVEWQELCAMFCMMLNDKSCVRFFAWHEQRAL